MNNSSAPPFQIPRFASVLLMELTISTSLGCDFPNSSTEDVNPFSDSFNNCGFFGSRVASWVEISVNPAMLCA